MKTIILAIIFSIIYLTNFTYSEDFQQKPLSEVLDQNGRIKIGVNGSFSGQGFSMKSGENGEPVFVDANEEWITLGSGVNNQILAIAISGNNVYVGGDFTTAGGITVNRIAKWNIVNSDWSAMGGGVNNGVEAIAVSGNDVYVGGRFTNAGGISASYIAKWNELTSVWTPLGNGFNSGVYSLALSGEHLYAGGNFNASGGKYLPNIAVWNTLTSSWSGLGDGMNGIVFAIAISGSNVYVGGNFTTAGGITVNRIAKWNTVNSDWSTMGGGVNNGVKAIAVSGNEVYIGGWFTNAGGISVGYIAMWDELTSIWSPLGTGVNSNVNALCILDNFVFVGGSFINASGIQARFIASWHRTNLSWSNLSSGMNLSVHALVISGADLFAGGSFTTAGGNPANFIAKWSDPLIGGNIIRGTAFRDFNGNNIQDPFETGVSNSIIEVIPGSLYFLTNSQGMYSAYVGSGNFTVSMPNPPQYYTPSPLTHSVSFSGVGNTINNKNFALFTSHIVNDAQISLTGITPPRPGFSYSMRITYKNIGTQVLSDNIQLNFPSNINYQNSSPPGNLSGNPPDMLEWTYSNLLPGEVRNININFTVSASMPLGTQLISVINIDPTDPTPWNNEDILEQIVIGSYDPNDKQVFPGGNITPQQVVDQDSLTYQIRFQNTGTADAITVVVRDTMSNKLDLGTFEMISASHSYICALDNDGEIRWTFNNINLPDSNTNEPGSHGYIKYRIKPKSNLVLGDEIRNTAYIYFDFNEPIITNTTISTVANPIGIVLNTNEIPNSYSLLQNYPNPFNPVTKIKYDVSKTSFVELIIYDILGREVSVPVSGESAPGKYEIDWNGAELSSGIYFYRLTVRGKGSASVEYTDTKKMLLIK